MYEEIYSVYIRILCIFVGILTVIRLFIFFNIKYEYSITIRNMDCTSDISVLGNFTHEFKIYTRKDTRKSK